MGLMSAAKRTGEPRDRRWSRWGAGRSDSVAEMLEANRTLTVVGLSSNCCRPSHGVAAYMKARGYRIIPVNPNETSVLGEKSYAAIEDVPEPLGIVVIFRRPEHVPAIVDGAIRMGAKVIWMQEGVVHEGAAARARRAGLEVVQDRCILKEYAKRFVAEGI